MLLGSMGSSKVSKGIFVVHVLCWIEELLDLPSGIRTFAVIENVLLAAMLRADELILCLLWGDLRGLRMLATTF